ncbi:MAG: type IV pilus modification protein PilV [Gammaproteobacteria bacterium]|nr:type IV pilus modification protein PilV [Gammaproteobacteria bacterium]
MKSLSAVPLFHSRTSPANRRRQSGVGMVEILVAVLVVSFGFLAAAQMQVRGMRFSQTAYFLSQANFMLNDITDRMRANRTGVVDGEYAGFTINGSTSAPTCISSQTPCNSTALAQADLHAWSSYLHDTSSSSDFLPLLPSGPTVTATGTITEDAATGVHTITVSWSEFVDGTEITQSLIRQFFP